MHVSVSSAISMFPARVVMWKNRLNYSPNYKVCALFEDMVCSLTYIVIKVLYSLHSVVYYVTRDLLFFFNLSENKTSKKMSNNKIVFSVQNTVFFFLLICNLSSLWGKRNAYAW